MPSQSSYYDIDAILAEEELVPCTTNFDFAHLAHLDADLHDKAYLPGGSRIKLPLWALEQWAYQNYVQLSLPRHYQRKARERLEAAPSEVNLRKKNERFFLAGRFLVDLIETSVQKVAKSAPSSRRDKLEQVAHEAKLLRNTLLKTYTGERLRQTLDWSLSSVGDDVTSYTNQLTEMERRLFQCGAIAATAHLRWRVFGKRRWLIRSPPPTAHTNNNSQSISTGGNDNKRQARAVSPDGDVLAAGKQPSSNKRQRR